MTTFVHELISHSAQRSPDAIALQIKETALTYSQLQQNINAVAQGYLSLEITENDRIGVYLAKNIEAVEAMFSCSIINAVVVPINPVLKAPQVEYIVKDCQISCLVTNLARLKTLLPQLENLTDLKNIIVIDSDEQKLAELSSPEHLKILSWQTFIQSSHTIDLAHNKTNNGEASKQLAAILYTSGSTGQPKGIMLSHENIVLGAKSVSQYTEQTPKDVILAVLPLSFDYGLNQLTAAFLVGAKCVLLDYLLANDVIKAITKYKVTGLAAVPPLWMQLAKSTWPTEASKSIRYFTNSGGVLPIPTLTLLKQIMPQAAPYLMYGLTEAFRSTFLSPKEVNNKPTSMGKAIPHAEILVLREDGSECNTDEVGELVHIGPLVALGYWQNSSATAERFKLTPSYALNEEGTALAVFSGDYVKKDNDGFLYFVSRKDSMIKTSGYRVSPTEIESVLLELESIDEVAIIPKASEQLGQEIIALIVPKASNTVRISESELKQSIIRHCQRKLPSYMMPKQVILLTELPRNANNKIDTNQLISTFAH